MDEPREREIEAVMMECPYCKAQTDDVEGCRFCERPMCYNCGSMPEGVCNDCADELEGK